jgi:CHAD domain-containing protein
VLLAYLADESATLETPEREAFGELQTALEGARDEARRDLLEAMESDRYVALLDALELAVAAPRVLDPETRVGALWKAEFKRLGKSMDRLGKAPPDEELHAARIKAKRARYAAELAAPVVGKRAERFAEGAKKLQDVLGEHQDAVFAEERLRRLLETATSPETHFAGGRVVERQRARRAAARAGYGEAWKRVEKLGRAVPRR